MVVDEEVVKRVDQCILGKSNHLPLNGLSLVSLPADYISRRLPNLSSLDCSYNKLASLPGIEKLNKLTKLDCSYNKLSNLCGMESLTQLTELRCSNNELYRLSGIDKLPLLTKLDCSKNRLDILAGIETLSQLTELDCHGNQLKKLPGIKTPNQLTKLDCHGNQLNSLTGIETLTQLTKLDCSNNQLKKLPGIETLTQLTKLDCHGNRLNSLTGIEKLPQLTKLYCHNNQLNSLTEIERLTQLTELYCHRNQLISLSELERLPQLTKLYSRDNPVKHIPHALLNNIDKLRDYWSDIRISGTLENNRHKLLLLGNGRVGKTTLANALIEQRAQLDAPACDSTIGIALREWHVEDTVGQGWKVRIWDFGGQELYHATHRLFQSQSVIYCVLWAEQPEEDACEHQHSLRYWLDLVTENNSDCPLIVVKNQIDRANKLGANNEALQDEQYCSLRHYQISALTYQDVETLETALKISLREQGELQTQIPKSWGKVRTILEKKGGKLDRQDFDGLCQQNGVSDSGTLLSYLHQCGDVFYRDGHFSNTIFVDQNWALKAIYRLFEHNNRFDNPRRNIENNEGKVTGVHLYEIFRDYPTHDVEAFVEFMLQAQMIFCLSEPTYIEDTIPFSQREYIVIALLPQSPSKALPSIDSATFKYRLHYKWLHRLAIEQLIATCHHLSTDNAWWRNGIRLKFDNEVNCNIEANSREATLTLAFWGNADDIKSSLPRVLKTIERTKVSSPIQESASIKGQNWCNREDLQLSAKLGSDVIDSDGGRQNGLAYFYFLGMECDDITKNTPSESSISDIKNIENLIMLIVKGDLHMNGQNISNSPNSVVANAQGKNARNEISVSIGNTPEERADRRAEVKNLLDAIERSDLTEKEKENCSIHLKTVQHEMEKQEPDKEQVKKSLESFNRILNTLKAGMQLFEQAKDLLTSFGG